MGHEKLLGLGSLVLGVAAVTGCSENVSLQQLENMYPVPARLAVRSADEIQANGSPAYVLNLTDKRYDPAVARDLYSYFENVGNLKTKLTYNIDGNNRILAVNPLKADFRATYLIPHNAPKPVTWTAKEDGRDGVTSVFFYPYSNNARQTFSLVEALNQSDSKSTPEWGTAAFATEVCQQMIDVEVLDLKGDRVSPQERLIGQEVVCNSLGTLLAYRYLNKSYEDYRKIISTLATDTALTDKLYPLIPFTRDSYESLPTPGAIFK